MGTTDNNIFVVVVIVVDVVFIVVIVVVVIVVIVVVIIRNLETKQVSIFFGLDRLTGGDGTELRFCSAVLPNRVN